jgi:DNA-directed RNA polymerase subunit M/transcription elongation factor TFIIS
MVYATVIQASGTISECQISSKTTDVLDWIRKKYKNNTIQFQGKLGDPTKEGQYLTIFASTIGNEENINQHMLPSPFDEEQYIGQIIVMMTAHEQQDEYEAGASLYVDLKSSYYELLYQEWTFAQSDEEEIENENDDELEEDEDAFSDDEEDIKQPIEYVSKPIQVRSKNVFVDCAIRDKVIKNFDEIVQNTELATQIEESMLHVVSDHAVKENMEVDWSNRVFWNMYRSKAISIYENLRGSQSYVNNTENWLSKLKSGEITPRAFAEMTSVDMCPARWKTALEKIIESEKRLYAKNDSASIFMWCSGCKKKTKCDYYQMQTRSADEPMTTFVNCLECDKRWKF